MDFETFKCPQCGWEYKFRQGAHSGTYVCSKCYALFDVQVDSEGIFKSRKNYGEIAVKAVELMETEVVSNPDIAWEKAVKELFSDETQSRTRKVAKDTFLALCEEGKIVGINLCKTNCSKQTKKEVLNLLKLIKHHPIMSNLPQGLLAISPSGKLKKGQLSVIVALWNNGLIRV